MPNETNAAMGGGSVANDGAGTPTGTNTETTTDVARSAKGSVREMRDDLKSQVREQTDRAKDSAERFASERKHTLAGTIEALATAFDSAASTLGERDEPRLADWTREISGRARRLASYLEENDTRGLMTDLEGSAREHPAAFVGSSFAAGVAAGRFLRSSSRPESGARMEVAGELQGDLERDAEMEGATRGDTRPTDPAFGASGATGGDASVTSGYGNTGSGYGTTGAGVGMTREAPSDAGFGPTETSTGPIDTDDSRREGGVS